MKTKITQSIQQLNFNGFNKSFIPLLKKAALATLAFKKKRKWQVNFILVSDMEIKKINAKYLKSNKITDVLSFLIVPEYLMGDVYISKERSKKQAKQYNHSWSKELAYLVLHSVLHLCGYTDYDEQNKKIMFTAQDKIFQCLFY